MVPGDGTTSTSSFDSAQDKSGQAGEVVPAIALEEPIATTTPATATSSIKAGTEDLPPQSQLANPPTEVRGLYVTGWIGGIPKRVDHLLDLAGKHGINAFVVDAKDYSGYVSYVTGNSEIRATGAEKQIRIARPNALIKQLHDRGIYAIARIAVFEDTILAEAHPEWALKRASDGKLWRDQKGLAWMDPASKDVWAYNVAIAKDALARGFDEVNFDYIRFPTDGSLKQISYPVWDGTTLKHKVIGSFFDYLDKNLPNAKISVDLFGLVTVDKTDLGIGQMMEDALGHVDAIAPMVYPSHFADGFQGYKNPAAHPYEVVNYSMSQAAIRFAAWEKKEANATSTPDGAHSTSSQPSQGSGGQAGQARQTRLRPWRSESVV